MRPCDPCSRRGKRFARWHGLAPGVVAIAAGGGTVDLDLDSTTATKSPPPPRK
jgi:hypothetical protein